MKPIERNSAEIEVNGKKFTINEINAEKVIAIIEGRARVDVTAVKELITEATSMTYEDIAELRISFGQMLQIYEVFKEVNAAFFTLFPLESLLKASGDLIRNSVEQSLSMLHAGLLPVDTADAGTTDGVISTSV